MRRGSTPPAPGSACERDPLSLPELPEAVTAQGDVRTHPGLWPERGGIDGFFIARLVRA